MDAIANESTKVQHVTKKSSDELLRKFAEVGDDKAKKELRVSKRRKRSRTRRDQSGDPCETPSHYSGTFVERRSLLSPATRKSVFLRQLGIGKSQLTGRDLKNRSILGSIEKTWRKTLEGASKVLLEKHYNRHIRLISDVV